MLHLNLTLIILLLVSLISLFFLLSWSAFSLCLSHPATAHHFLFLHPQQLLWHEAAGAGGSPRPSPKKRKAGVCSAATFSREQVAARWQSYQARMQQPDMQQLAGTRASLPIASYRSALCMLAALPTAHRGFAFCKPEPVPLVYCKFAVEGMPGLRACAEAVPSLLIIVVNADDINPVMDQISQQLSILRTVMTMIIQQQQQQCYVDSNTLTPILSSSLCKALAQISRQLTCVR